MEYVYSGLTAVGLDTMLKRLLFGTFVAGAAVYYFQPSFAFYKKEGDDAPRIRPWKLWSGADAEMPTFLPFWAIPIIAGFVFAMFI